MKIKRVFKPILLLTLLLITGENLLWAKPEPPTEKKNAKILPALLIIPIVFLDVWRLTHRSGVTHKAVRRALPGDDLVPDANWVIDRSVVLDAPIDKVWPWIQQLGRNRAGWYAPNWLETLYGHHALCTVDSLYQRVKKGDILDDWGPGYQRVLQISPPNLLLVEEVEKVKVKSTGKDSLFSMHLSILMVLEKVDSMHTRITYRLRGKVGTAIYIPARILGGLFDYATFAMMTSGLNERLRKEAL
jgi:hypothetical protein